MIKHRLLPFIGSLAISCAPHAQTLQDPTQIVTVVEEFLHTQAESYGGTATIHVSEPTIRHQAACEQLQPYLASGAKLRARMTIPVRCQAPEPWTLRVQAELTIMGHYYVSSRTLELGQHISSDDLVPREGDLLRLPASVITDSNLLVGYITTQRIKAGNTLRANSLRDPQSIERGQSVRTVAQGMGFTATGEGTALQSGAPGSQIQVRVRSGKVISGTVLDAHTVRVF